MKLNKKFTMRALAGEHILIPTDVSNVDFTHVLSLNEMAANIWKIMENGDFTVDDVTKKIYEEYEVSLEQAKKDVQDFILKLREYGILMD